LYNNILAARMIGGGTSRRLPGNPNLSSSMEINRICGKARAGGEKPAVVKGPPGAAIVRVMDVV
jgi:hypothetical protein